MTRSLPSLLLAVLAGVLGTAQARNAELKALIVKVRAAIAAHLHHAQHLQSALGK